MPPNQPSCEFELHAPSPYLASTSLNLIGSSLNLIGSSLSSVSHLSNPIQSKTWNIILIA